MPVYAALASLGRDGVTALVEKLVTNAQLVGEELKKIPGCFVMNDVVFTQVTFCFEDDERTKAIEERLIQDPTVWISGSHWQGKNVLRISVSNWTTDGADVAVAVEAVRRAAQP